MTAVTRCCSCGNEIPYESDVWKGAHEDETCCSVICRYSSIVDATDTYSEGWREHGAGLARVMAFKEAVLYDPEIFGETEFSVTVAAVMRDGRESVTAGMIVLGAGRDSVSFEIVRSPSEDGEFDGDEALVPWDDVLDVVMVP